MRTSTLVLCLLTAAVFVLGTHFTVKPIIDENYAAGHADGHALGQGELAMDLIEACLGNAEFGECVLKYDVKDTVIMLSIGTKQVYCRKADLTFSC